MPLPLASLARRPPAPLARRSSVRRFAASRRPRLAWKARHRRSRPVQAGADTIQLGYAQPPSLFGFFG
jgi:hypothetical protein